MPKTPPQWSKQFSAKEVLLWFLEIYLYYPLGIYRYYALCWVSLKLNPTTNAITLVNSKMLRRRKTIVFQCFRCAEPKSAIKFCLSRPAIKIFAFYSTYFHSNLGQLLNLVATIRFISDKQMKLITSHSSLSDVTIDVMLHNKMLTWYNYSQLCFYFSA